MMMAAPMMAPQSQEMTGALMWGKKQITLPTLKMVAVPKPQQAQMVTIQQAPMMMAPQMMAPQMMAPQMMMSAPAAPSCPSTDAANLQLMQALIQASHQQNAPAAAPSADETELEARAMKLEQKLDALTKALENGQ